APFTVTVKKKKSGAPPANANGAAQRDSSAAAKDNTETRQFPAGSYVVRMDQPYSRIADALLDYQYWSPNDPQRNVYDDTGWTFGEAGNVQVVRVTDAAALNAPMALIKTEVRAPGGGTGSRALFVI